MSLTLRDRSRAARGQAGLGLGTVDEELSTVTEENKPHSCAWSFEDKLMSLYGSLQFTVPSSYPFSSTWQRAVNSYKVLPEALPSLVNAKCMSLETEQTPS